MLKNLIFKQEDEPKVPDKRPSFHSTPPVTPTPSFTPPVHDQNVVVSSKVKEVYNQEFKKCDTPGIDYYEFHNGVMNAGVSKSSVDMMFNLLKGMSPTMSKEMLVMQANGAIEKLDQYVSEASRLAESKKQGIIETYSKTKFDLEQRKSFILSEIDRLNAELHSIQTSIDSMSSNSAEVQTIDATYKEFLQVHHEFKSNVQQIISHLNAGL